MALPKIEHPIYDVYLLSLDKKVKFRPFLVKEEKLLLMAKESKDSEEIKRTVIQIVNNCLLEPIDVEKLPLFDIEMIFISLRARSVGEKVKLTFSCKHKNDETGEPCNSETPYELNIDNVTYSKKEDHTNLIKLTEDMGVKMMYPTFKTSKIDSGLELFEAALQLIAENIEYIYDKESIYKSEDMIDEELINFIENLNPSQLEKIQSFFQSTPKVIIKDTIKCRKCGFEHEMEADNIYSFFT